MDLLVHMVQNDGDESLEGSASDAAVITRILVFGDAVIEWLSE